MLGTVEIEIRKPVDADKRQERLGVGAFDNQFIHVVGLVEQHGMVAPRALFITPVGEFGGHDGIDIHPDLGVAQHVYRIGVLGHKG